MGMSPEDYWHGSPELTEAYRQAHKIRLEEKNYEFWLQGLYFKHALDVALSHMTDKHSKAEYMSEPIKIFPPTQEEIEEQQKKEAAELERRLNAFMVAFNGRQTKN